MLLPSVRKIHNVNSTKVIGDFYSHKMGGFLRFESTLERDWLLWLEYRRDVLSYLCQPQTFSFVAHAKGRQYTPDVLVEFNSNRRATCFEVKPADICDSPRIQRRFRYCAAAVEQHGYDFEVVTEVDIRPEPQLTNLKRLASYASEPALTESEARVLYGVMDSLGTSSIHTVLQACTESGMPLTLNAIYRELFCGGLDADITQPLNRLSHIWAREVRHVA